MLILAVKAKVQPGKLDEFKALMAYFEKRMATNEPNYAHRIYLSEDQTEITFFESYADEAAIVKHFEEHQADPKAQAMMRETFEITSVEAFGAPFEQTAEVLRLLNTKFYPHPISVIDRAMTG